MPLTRLKQERSGGQTSRWFTPIHPHSGEGRWDQASQERKRVPSRERGEQHEVSGGKGSLGPLSGAGGGEEGQKCVRLMTQKQHNFLHGPPPLLVTGTKEAEVGDTDGSVLRALAFQPLF